MVLSLQFTAIDLEVNGSTCIDSVTVTDGTGTILMDKTCGGSTYGYLVEGGQNKGTLLPNINTTTNLVMISYKSSNNYVRTWHLNWSASPTATGGYTLPFGCPSSYIPTTRCQILCSMRLHCVSKTLTPRRMH